MVPTFSSGTQLVVLAVPALLFLLGLADLTSSFMGLHRFRRTIRLATRNDTDVFGTNRQFEVAANDVVNKLQTSIKNKTVSYFNAERELRPVATLLQQMTTRPKSVAGVLIICGLLITLFNLRISVGSLRDMFGEKPVGAVHDNRNVDQKSSQPIDAAKIQTGMQRVAQSAETAFGYSASTITGAAILLLLSIVLQRQVIRAMRGFSWFVYSWHEDQLAELAKLDKPQNMLGDFVQVIQNLTTLTETFEVTNRGLTELAVFGGKIDAAAQSISTAVGQLPTQIDASMIRMSSDVARGINEDLKHQLEYLKNIAKIYGDQQLTLVEVQKFTAKLAESTAGSAKALNDIPTQLRAIASQETMLTGAVSQLKGTIAALDAKVARLPAEKLESAADNLNRIATDFQGFEKKLSSLEQQLATRVQALTQLDRTVGTTVQAIINPIAEQLAALGSELRSSSAVSTEIVVKKADILQDAAERIQHQIRVLQAQAGPTNVGAKLEEILNELYRVPKLPFRHRVVTGNS